MAMLRVLVVLLGSLALASALAPTWSLFSSQSGEVGKSANLPGLGYVRALNSTNGTLCSMIAFDAVSFNGAPSR
jgi:hypothetical protein